MKSNDPHPISPSFGEQIQRASRWERRDFLKGIAAVAGSAGLLGYDMKPASAESPPGPVE